MLEKTRCVLNQAKLGKKFWAETVSTACYLIHRSPHIVTPHLTSSVPKRYGIFGCPTYIHVNEEKLEPRAKKCILVGYGLGVKGYRVRCESLKGKLLVELLSLDIVLPNNVDSTHDTCEEVEPPRFLKLLGLRMNYINQWNHYLLMYSGPRGK